MSALDREKALGVLNDLIEGEYHVVQQALDDLEKCVLDDVAVTGKLADPAIAWYADQHRAVEAKLSGILNLEFREWDEKDADSAEARSARAYNYALVKTQNIAISGDV